MIQVSQNDWYIVFCTSYFFSFSYRKKGQLENKDSSMFCVNDKLSLFLMKIGLSGESLFDLADVCSSPLPAKQTCYPYMEKT